LLHLRFADDILILARSRQERETCMPEGGPCRARDKELLAHKKVFPPHVKKLAAIVVGSLMIRLEHVDFPVECGENGGVNQGGATASNSSNGWRTTAECWSKVVGLLADSWKGADVKDYCWLGSHI